jgi:hypothetical protein
MPRCADGKGSGIVDVGQRQPRNSKEVQRKVIWFVMKALAELVALSRVGSGFLKV